MSFWSDSSSVVKGAIVVGAVGFLYLGVAWFSKIAPFGRPDGEAVSSTRGVQGAK